MFVFAALSYGVVKTLGLKPGLPAAGIMFAGMVGTITAQNAIYYPAAMGILLQSGSTNALQVSVTWLQNMIHMFPALLLDIFLVWFMLKLIIPKPEINAKDELQKQYLALGKMSKREIKAIIVIIGIMLSLILSQWTGMDTALPFLVAPWLFFIPGLRACDYSALKKVNIGMVFLVAGFLSIGAVANELGIGALGSLYILQFTGGMILFPYESLVYLVYMSFGVISMKDYIKLYAIINQNLKHIF